MISSSPDNGTLGEGIETELRSRVSQGEQDSSTAHALPAVGTEGGFQAQGFHWTWITSVVFKVSAM